MRGQLILKHCLSRRMMNYHRVTENSAKISFNLLLIVVGGVWFNNLRVQGKIGIIKPIINFLQPFTLFSMNQVCQQQRVILFISNMMEIIDQINYRRSSRCRLRPKLPWLCTNITIKMYLESFEGG